MRNLLIALFAGGVFAAIIFQVGLEPRVAGLFAGSSFIAVGIYGVVQSWKRRKSGALNIAVLTLSIVHLLGIAVPMLGFRVMNWNEPFSKVAVWGLSGPEFHQISTRFYGAWTILVAIAWWAERKKDPRGSFSEK